MTERTDAERLAQVIAVIPTMRKYAKHDHDYPSIPLSHLQLLVNEIARLQQERDAGIDAAQPPAPEALIVSDEEWEHFIKTMNAPAMPSSKLIDLLKKRSLWESAPPQPGDAERYCVLWEIAVESRVAAEKERDAAQSALAESEARCKRLAEIGLIAACISSSVGSLDDREIARQLMEAIVEDPGDERWNDSNIIRIERAIAGAHARGVRVEQKRCISAIESIKLEAEADRSGFTTESDKDAASCWIDCASQIIWEIERALVAPKPQEKDSQC